jgi:hypothetical protein
VILHRVTEHVRTQNWFMDGGYFDAWLLRPVWQDHGRRVREHPRFFELATQLGLVQLWETRGYPPGCMRVASPEGDRLACPGTRPSAS